VVTVSGALRCVQVAVLRAMLTIVSSTAIQVHYVVLLLIIRACYNIFIMSRSETTQQTAKAVLTQITNIVFQRLLAGRVVQVRPVNMLDLSAVTNRAEQRREVQSAQSVVMSVWNSISQPHRDASSAISNEAALLFHAEADNRCGSA
jgi:hypothetical protein